MTTTRTIKVKQLARVEGDGGFSIRVRDGRVCDVKMNIFEPPRLFEAFVRGRHYTEVPDLTARICGICPLAHMLGASQAMETGLGIPVSPVVRALRELVFLGEWISSHSLHIHLLHAPDFFGCDDVLALSRHHPEAVRRGIRLKQVGNDMVRRLGGREVHPVNLRIGGLYKMPSLSDINALRQDLEWAREAARETIGWTADLPFPDFEQDYLFLALHDPENYAVLSGRLLASTGEEMAINDFESFMREEQVAHATALHGLSRRHGAYLVGPLARFNLNFSQLSPGARAAAESVGVTPPCGNPFKGIIIRSIEIMHACERALVLMDQYRGADPSASETAPFSTTGYGCVEAPRGVCWHKYRLDERGNVVDARIVPPTSQNLRSMETDLHAFADRHQGLKPERLAWQCEQLVRSYDPCISCSSHRINLQTTR